MLVLTTLANAGSGIGHVQLFRACAEWMRKGHSDFFAKSDDKEDVMIDNACRILEYMCDVITALKLSEFLHGDVLEIPFPDPVQQLAEFMEP